MVEKRPNFILSRFHMPLLSRRDQEDTLTLAVCQTPVPYTADHVRGLVDVILEEWDIQTSKVKVVVTDNGSKLHFVLILLHLVMIVMMTWTMTQKVMTHIVK